MEERFRLLEEAPARPGPRPRAAPRRGSRSCERSASQRSPERRRDHSLPPRRAKRSSPRSGPFVAYIGGLRVGRGPEGLGEGRARARSGSGRHRGRHVATPDPQLFVTVSDDLVGGGVDASALVREAVAVSGGKGGGRPEMAQGRTSGPDGLAAGDGDAARAAAGIADGHVGLPQAADATRLPGRSAGHEHGPRHRHGVREGPRLHDERRRGGGRHRRRPAAPGPLPHAVGDRRRHPRGRAQLSGRARRGRGDGRVRARRASSSASQASW